MNRVVLFLCASAGGALLTAAPSFAAAIDVTAITGDITAQAVPIAAVGAAITVLFLGIKAFKWVRKAF